MPHAPRTRKAAQRAVAALVLAVPATILSPSSATAAPSTDAQWHLDAMKAEQMWQVSEGEGVTVAVIDSDIDRSLPELKGQVLPTRNFSQERDTTKAAKEHGTSMAALIAGTGAGSGIKGLAPKSKILPIVLHESDLSFAQLKRLPRAIDYAVSSGAKIINMSFGTAIWEDVPRQTQNAIHRAQKAGVLVFASSGNDGHQSNSKHYPAAIPGVIAVGATDRQAKPAKFSSNGPHLALAAPGAGVVSRCEKNTTTCPGNGTSAATALVSASAALIWAKYPEWTNNQVLRALIQTAGRPGATADDPPNTRIGYGTVRPRLVLEGKADPGDPDKHPTFSKYYAELAAKSPQPEASSQLDSPNSEPSAGSEAGADTGADTATGNSGDDSNSTPLLIGGGLAAAALLAGGGVYLHTRRRSHGTRL
ncbi:S8 family serine peptidase [Streptomyces sp. XM4193]|uniref:S8 family serine peptidase n=1 Tax=Streptomyces sp. XM4193 TaxID=2929782 RepID=UPI001FF95544|nr:S8 family serine peptidase [Streptomyces sp. XM4193]MCK1795748.1 S8 family serine peptidase [Streptomyces sp. XM4193]